MRRSKTCRYIVASGLAVSLLMAMGCAGDKEAGFGSVVTVLRSASGPAFNELSKHFSVRTYTGASSLTGSAMLVVDGDVITGDEVLHESAIDAALTAGILVVLVDAQEEHKRGLAEHFGALSHSGGTSDLFALQRTVHDGRPLFGSYEIPRKSHQIKRNHITHRDGNRIEGSHSVKDVQGSFVPSSVGSFLAAVEADKSRSLFRGSAWYNPPAGIPNVYQSHFICPQPLPDQAVEGQITGESIVYQFFGFVSDDGGGNFSQQILMMGQAQLDAGPLLYNGEPVGPYPYLGYLQTWSEMAFTVANSSSTGESVNAVISTLFQGGDDAYTTGGSVPIGYETDAGRQTWMFEPLYGNGPETVSIPGWTGAASVEASQPGAKGISYQIYQATPFSGLSPNYVLGYSGSGFAPFPAISSQRIVYECAPLIKISPPIQGLLSTTAATGRRFVKLGGDPSAQPADVVSVDGDALPFFFHMSRLHPPELTNLQKGKP